MTINQFFHTFYEQLISSSLLECLGVLFGIMQVWLARSNKSINYLFGILSVSITLVVLYEVKLYAEILLNSYYLVMSIYGWWFWFAQKQVAERPISYSSRTEWIRVALICIVGFFILFFVLDRYTDSDVPIMDSFVSSFAWAGMWLLARRKMENWILLNISNFVAIPLLYHKGLYLYALLTLFYFIIAFLGYANWRKIYLKQNLSTC